MKSFYLCPFHCKARPSGVSLESPGLENIPQVPGNGAEVGENHDARKATRLLYESYSKVGLYLGLEAGHPACAPFSCVHFT